MIAARAGIHQEEWLDASRANMVLALTLAAEAGAQEEIPVGAVLVDEQGRILAASGNRSVGGVDPMGHAEMRVLHAGALRTDNYRLSQDQLFVTLEPCSMCLSAMGMARLASCRFAAWREWRADYARLAAPVAGYAEVAGGLLRFFLMQKREVLNTVADSVLMSNSEGMGSVVPSPD